MPEFYIKHLTQYSYQGLVHDSANQVILYPVTDAYQEVYKQDLKITGDPEVYVHNDYYDNRVGNFTLRDPHNRLEILSTIHVVTKPRPLPIDTIFSGEQWKELAQLQKVRPFIDYLNTEYFENARELAKVIMEERQQEHTPFKTSLRYCRFVYENFEYIPGITNVETTPDEIWNLKAGVCQDFAHILLVMLRQVNIPARYVSGYICPNKNGMRGEGATHAWVETYIPNYGWLGLDPTNNCIVNDTHVRLAVGRNFSDCSPVKGVYKGAAEHDLKVLVTISYHGDESEMVEFTPVPVIQLPNQSLKNSFKEHQMMIEQQQQ
jgi:transglutaminase-like putative cysteine protease